MPDLTEKLRAIGATFRAAEQHQHADAIAEAVALLETKAIEDNLVDLNAEASDNGVEWGQYVERDDRGEWTPLIYSSEGDREHAETGLDNDLPPFRNRRLVCRAVGDWKVVQR